MEINYAGELLWPGRAGHLALIISFVTSLLAFFAYWQAQRNREMPAWNSWRFVGNISFGVQALGIVVTMGLLYYLIFTHRFEYEYVRGHSSTDMPLKYLVSCFWAGQQGSFLLWIFWHSLLGLAVMKWVDKKWSVPVLATLSILQVVLISMLLGIYINRGIVLLALFLALNAFFWYLLKKYGQAGWKSLVPVLNLAAIFKTREKPNAFWLLFLLALPVNILVLVILPMHAREVADFLSANIKLGVDPFELTREAFPDNALFLMSDYVTQIRGTGLNPLLENYWMVIHPPTLFLGFASTSVPFGFLMASFWNRDFTSWTRPVFPWTVFSALILGTGIIMGGLWAYESLSFGGFWAWDPVENASFVPWLTLVAALHTLLIYMHSKYALRSTYILIIITFFLILYSTFLTRSGILGDSSVHSFTDLGMMGQLIVLIIAFILPALILLADNWKSIPNPQKEEKTSSREFWMFVGSLVLLISSIQITFTTSIPVLNSVNTGLVNWFPFLDGFKLLGIEIFKTNYAPPQDAETFYNSIQVWFAILIALLSAFVQFLRYKKSDWTKVFRKLAAPFFISLVLTVAIQLPLQETNFAYLLLLFAGLFTLTANLNYLLVVLKGKIRIGGASVTHLGFGLLLASMVITLANSKIISRNTSGMAYSQDMPAEFNLNNLKLNLGQPEWMEKYRVTYTGKEIDGRNYYYRIAYDRIDTTSGDTLEHFVLKPHLLDHPRMGIVVNPATKHYWNRDIFTHVTSVPLDQSGHVLNKPTVNGYNAGIGDTFFISKGMAVFSGFQPVSVNDTLLSVDATVTLIALDQVHELHPKFMIGKTQTWSEPDSLGSMKIAISTINPETGDFTFNVLEQQDWVIMKAIVFPFIILLWTGIVLTITGFFISLLNRIREHRRIAPSEKT